MSFRESVPVFYVHVHLVACEFFTGVIFPYIMTFYRAAGYYFTGISWPTALLPESRLGPGVIDWPISQYHSWYTLPVPIRPNETLWGLRFSAESS